MNDERPRHCPNCNDLLVPVEASLNRSILNAVFFGFGSSQLQIRLEKGRWKRFMTPSQNAEGLYCTSCGALTLAPSLPEHRNELGLS